MDTRQSHDTGGSASLNSPFIVEPASTHSHSIILLHGLGSNGTKFGKELLETAIGSDGRTLTQLLPGARFIFPTAKRRRSSAFSRAKLTQWFDIALLDDPSYRKHTQIQGLEESYLGIHDLITREASIVSAKNILLGGLSQGMAMAVILLLALEHPVGGFIGMSGWMPFREDIHDLVIETAHNLDADDDDDPFGYEDDDDPSSKLEDEKGGERDPIVRVVEFARDLLSVNGMQTPTVTQTAITTPIYLGHGSEDEKVTINLGEEARDTLETIGFNVKWESYPGLGHWYKIPDEIDDLVKFIESSVGWKLEKAE